MAIKLALISIFLLAIATLVLSGEPAKPSSEASKHPQHATGFIPNPKIHPHQAADVPKHREARAPGDEKPADSMINVPDNCPHGQKAVAGECKDIIE